MKLHISYKREGNGFQCDAACESGYTFAFWFRHREAPNLPNEFKHLGLSPTARRVVWLAQQLPNEWTEIYMDNIFNLRKLFTALYLAKALAHGAVCTSGRGLPASVLQVEDKNVKRAESLRGRTRAARLSNCPECPNLIAVSVYDTKPVHMISTTVSAIRWMEKRRRVWSVAEAALIYVIFLLLNLIDDYNNNMNGTDISDQLRNQYRPDHWMRNRKWWWAFLFGQLGLVPPMLGKCTM